MEKFAFIIHPIDLQRDVSRSKKYWMARFLPDKLIEDMIKRKEPTLISHITGVRSATGVEAEGWFIALPLSPRQLISLPVEFVYDRMIQCGKLAESLGAKIIGLGAFTSVAGDGGITMARNVDIAVTTGNSYTVGSAIEATIDGAARMGISMPDATVAVVGATGSIGRTCAHILGSQAAELVLIGRDQERLEAVREEMPDGIRPKTSATTNIPQGLKNANVIVTVTSAVDVVLQPEDLRTGAVVCDVARPRDVSVRVAKKRNDVLVIEGGVVAVPGEDLDFRFHFGFPPRTAYACMSETMILALEGRYESFTLGKTVTVAQVEQITSLAQKHGFKLAGYRSFEKAVDDAQIERIKGNAIRRGMTPSPRAAKKTVSSPAH